MADLFDYMFLYILSLFLAVLKFTMFISWPWWVIAMPALIGLSLVVLVAIASR